jgi:hypothetical protein
LAGYKNRFINLTFPDLSEDGDTVYVSIRSPRTVPPSQLQPVSLPENADGTPVDPRAAEKAMYDVIAGLIVSWHVYDGTSLDDGPAAAAAARDRRPASGSCPPRSSTASARS